MKRATKKALALAVGGLWITQIAATEAHAQDNWQTSTGSEDWFTAGNWSLGVPGSSSQATFSTVIPPSNEVTLGATNTSVGAIIDDLPDLGASAPHNLTIDGSTSTVTFQSVNYTATYATLTTGTPFMIDYPNAVMGIVDKQTAHADDGETVTFSNGITTALTASENDFFAAPYSAATKKTGQGTELIVNGSVVNSGAANAGVYVGGGGQQASDGGQVYFASSSNNYTGGTVVGQANETDSAIFQIAPDTVTLNSGGSLQSVNSTATGTGNVTINDGSQLLLTGNSTDGETVYFMNTHTTLTLNGIGIGNNSSGVLRTNGGSTLQTFVVLSSVVLGTTSASDNLKDIGIVFSPTSAPTRTIQLAGPVTNLPGFTGINKQGAGNLEFANPNNNFSGFMQIGNGDVTVDPGSSIGSGDLVLYQTSTNTAYINFENASETVGNLISGYTTSGTAGEIFQNVNLYGTLGYTQGPGAALAAAPGSGTTLILNQTNSTPFGYTTLAGFQNNTSTIDGPGNLELSSTSTGTLSLTGPNTYTGTTVINGGTLNAANGIAAGAASATGTVGNVIVNHGAALSSGNNVPVLGVATTSGTVGGSNGGVFTNLIVNNGGELLPGGSGLLGTLDVGGNLDATTGADLNFDLIGGTSASNDVINVANNFVGSAAIVNVLGSKLAFGNYTLFTVGSLTGSTPLLGSVPNSSNRSYSFVTVNNGDGTTGIVLDIQATGTDRFWSINGVNAPVDGSGNWFGGGTNFFVQNATSGTVAAAYSNSSTADLIFGNTSGGTVAITSPVTVGGPLVFSAINGSYTITGSGSNTLTVSAGIVSQNTTTISAPVTLAGAQTFTTSVGTTLALTGGISGSGGLTTGDQGTILVTGTGSYTGGTNVSQGILELGNAAALPTAGGVQISTGANLEFGLSSNGTVVDTIGGSGGIIINNTASTVSVRLSNTGNTYTGTTNVQNGILQVDNVNELGGGLSSLVLSGGTLQLTANGLNFPGRGDGTITSPNTSLQIVNGTTNTIDTDGNNVTMNQHIFDIGTLNVASSTGHGTLTLTGLITTTIIGTLGVGSNASLTFDPPPGVPSFGFSAPTTNNGFAGNFTVASPMDVRIQGGNISGGGTVYLVANNLNVDADGNFSSVNIGNIIVLNPSNSVVGFGANIYASSGNTLTIAAPISGNGSVNFSGGSGEVFLTNTSTYTGSTLVDLGSNEVQLDVNNALPVTTDVTITGAGSQGSALDLYGVTQTIDSLSATSAQAQVINESSTPATLIIDSPTGVATTFSGLLEDGQNSYLNLTLGLGNYGSLTLNGDQHLIAGGMVDEGPAGLTGAITILNGRLDIQNPAALGDPSSITIGGGSVANDAQLHFNGITSALVFASTNNPSGGPVPPIYLDGLGGYTPVGGTFEPGAIDVVGSGNVVLRNAITLEATSQVNVGTFSSLTFQTTITGPGGLVVSANNLGGIVNLQASNTYGGGTTLYGATTVVIAANGLPLNGAVFNGATLQVAADQTIGQLTGTGSLEVSNSSTLQIAPSSGPNTAGSIQIDSGSKLDITNNRLAIQFGLPANDPVASVAAALTTGAAYNGSSDLWTGNGITTSAALTFDNKTITIGYLDGNNAYDAQYGTVAANTVLVKYTVAGDAFLENSVGFRDLLSVAQHYQMTGQDYAHGNFFYATNGSVGFSDLLAVAQSYGESFALSGESSGGNTLTLSFSAPATSAVPEPGSVALVAAGAGALLARRRRQTR